MKVNYQKMIQSVMHVEINRLVRILVVFHASHAKHFLDDPFKRIDGKSTNALMNRTVK